MSDLTGACQLPEIRVLGPVTITADGPLAPQHRRRLTELGAYLALADRPPAPTAVEDAVWPGQHPAPGTRWAAMSRLRGWWGVDDEGLPYVERHTSRVRAWTDWHQVRTLTGYAGGIADLTDTRTEDLIAALRLVRGRPFAGAQWAARDWVDRLRVDIEYLVDQITGEVLARDPHQPAADLARHVRGLVVPWPAAS